MQDELRNSMYGLEEAWVSLHGLVVLKDRLMRGANMVEIAQAVGEQLLTMQQRLADEASSTEVAMNHAQQLLDLNEALAHNDIDVPTSQAHLNALMMMEQQLSGQSNLLTDAMQSLDLLVSFQEEFTDQIQILGEMRRSLIEIGMMETTVAKAIRTLQPLLELGNVRWMSDDEIRNAARNILDERSTRLTEKSHRRSSEYGQPGVFDPSNKDQVVPEPTDAE